MIKHNFSLIIPVLQELYELSEKSEDNNDKLSHLNVLIQHVHDLMRYERYGIFDLTWHLNELKKLKQSIMPEAVHAYRN